MLKYFISVMSLPVLLSFFRKKLKKEVWYEVSEMEGA
jgi:hypothetical protein